MIPIVKAHSTEVGAGGRVARRPGARRHGLHRGNRRRAALCATRASRRSTKARPASRRTISSAARRRATAAPPAAPSLPRCARLPQALRDAPRPALHPIGAGARGERCARCCKPSTGSLRHFGIASARRARRCGGYLQLWGLAAGGWQLGRAALIAADELVSGGGDSEFLRNKIATRASTRYRCFRRPPALRAHRRRGRRACAGAGGRAVLTVGLRTERPARRQTKVRHPRRRPSRLKSA